MKIIMARFIVVLIVAAAALAVPATPASAQSSGSPKHDSIVDGLLIGAAAGVAGGWLIAPRIMCSHNDPECTAAVMAAVGLPMIGAGVALGGIVDKLHDRQPLTWHSRDGRQIVHVDPLVGRRTGGLHVTWRFR
jgi:hypothetical protein